MDNISLNSFQNDVTEKVVEKVKTQFYVQKHVFFFSWKSCRFKRYVERYCRVWEATYDNIIVRMGFTCWIT